MILYRSTLSNHYHLVLGNLNYRSATTSIASSYVWRCGCGLRQYQHYGVRSLTSIRKAAIPTKTSPSESQVYPNTPSSSKRCAQVTYSSPSSPSSSPPSLVHPPFSFGLVHYHTNRKPFTSLDQTRPLFR